MWELLISATKSLAGSSKIYIVLALAILGSTGWGYYEKMRADDLETQVALYKQKADSAQTIDELNKQTARANEETLNASIQHQNELFQKLADITSAQSQNVLAQLNKSQSSTAAQYSKVTETISKIQISSCDGMVSEMIKFPQDANLQWITR